MVRLQVALPAGLSITGSRVSRRESTLSKMLRHVVLLAKLFVVAAFSVVPAFGTHQLSNVEKRHHELGAQRNELFAEMQDLLRQQKEEVATCRAALVEMARKVEESGTSPGVCADPSRAAEEPPAAAAGQTDQIPTIVGARRSSEGGRELGEEGARRLKDGEAADFANYFCSYAELDHQKQMLEDDRRMLAYRDSMMGNKDFFRGKTVLDVGSGSGVLAIFAAQAGAKKVYAVEYTDMARHARTLVEDNDFGDVVEVMQDSAESVELPEKVDIIVSEWMGYFLLRESMLDSVLVARDRWLKEDGVMFPSHASMVWAVVSDEEAQVRKDREYQNSLQAWSYFVKKSREEYGLEMRGLDAAYDKECQEYYSFTSEWRKLSSDQVVSDPVIVKELDLHTCTLNDSRGLAETAFSFELEAGDPPATGFAGWFDVAFRGREGVAPLRAPVELSTSPAAGYTHWGQQVFKIEEAVHSGGAGGPTVTIEGTVSMVRQATNPRLYNVKIEHRQSSEGQDGAVDKGDLSSTVYKLS